MYQKHANSTPTKRNCKCVKRNYHVSPQTAYHISQLALETNTSEGRIIDKILRTYLVNRGSYSEES